MDTTSLCGSLSPMLHLIGQFLNIFKMALPLILIVFAIIDIAKAIISSKSDAVKENLKKIIYKVIAVVVVFFIPTILTVIFSFVGEYNELKDNELIKYDICYDCMFNPTNSNCTNAVEISDAINQ